MTRKAVALYYGLTPVFWLADWALGTDLRVPGLAGHPFWQSLYYLLCVACGFVVWKRPAWTRAVGLGESTVNILLVVLAIWVPYFEIVDRLAAGAAIVDPGPFSGERLAGLVLSGLAWSASFYLQIARPRPARSF